MRGGNFHFKVKTMTRVFIFIYYLLFLSCVHHSSEPAINLDKEKRIALAKMEIYKLSIGNNCDCTAIVYKQGEGVDTVNIFSLDLKMDTTIISADTIFYYFSFWKQDAPAVADVFTPGKPFPECAHYYAVGYIGGSSKPFMALIAENAYALYGIDIDVKELDSKFKKCLHEKKHVLNKWLKEHTEHDND